MSNLVVYSIDEVASQTFEVSEAEVTKVLDDRDLLVKALDIEIIYDQIIEAYWAYRSKVNYWNLRYVSSPFPDYIFNHEVRSSLNRLAFNLFNLSKLYLDWHYNKKKNRCFSFELTNQDGSKQQVIDHRSKIYNNNLKYVVGYKLRGHSQHSALPVRTFTTGVHKDHNTSNRTANFNIYYYYEDLEKAGVPKEMLHKGIKLDLTDIIDGFIFAISQKHMLNRKLTEVVVGNARVSLKSMGQNYAAKADLENYAAKADLENYRCEVHTQENKRVNLSLEWFDVFDHLNEKHSNSINYSNITFEK